MLKQRVITALWLAPLAIGGIFFLPYDYFALFTAAIVMLGAWEWANLAGFKDQAARVGFSVLVGGCLYGLYTLPELGILSVGLAWWVLALVFVLSYPGMSKAWSSEWVRLVFGLFILIPCWKGLLLLKQQQNSELVLLYICLMVWGADVGAYFSGRKWGVSKLAPKVSPGKSWAGFWGGMVSALIIGLGVGLYVDMSPAQLAVLMLISSITVAVSVLGDLTESMFKRFRGIKDSSQLLPGHGGVLDRIDSLTAAVPVFALLLLVSGISF
ncbi:phosphatidate cytidylyltransferase [Litoribrevibacter albus]|uniref:Phosphatidate cytidylyltransferase n=1 Tax=Litoribrevibacter albus TaxID=1473156 RepID=A0AA37SAM7_9GAMM|nr:phosphatidate cytidylyltransferase [Litoribrevibacter albus]GLQ31174.1 phosphatidate cytidylyltransferase [Litoribrevibacter albus]